MRCLYCGKELALLKRLTGGAEFCTDAHRKRYQEEFNDLALSRLLQVKAPPAPPLAPEPPPVLEPPPVVAAAAPPKTAAPKAPVPKAAAPAPRAAAPPAAPKPKTAPDPVVPLLSYLVEQPSAGQTAYAVVGGEAHLPPSVRPALPGRNFVARDMVRAHSLAWASPITMNAALSGTRGNIHPREGNLEIREFSRKAIAPAVTPQQTFQRSQNSVLGGAIGEPMDITNQPHPPADLPVIWQAGPHASPPVDLQLGDLARLDFSPTGFGENVPPAQSRPAGVAQMPLPAPTPAAPPAPSFEAVVAKAPVPQPAAAREQSPPVVPQAATKPLPVTLHGSGAGAAKPASIVSGGAPVAIQPQVPTSSALPLRPTMVLAPRPAPVAPKPEPVAAQPAPAPKPAVAAQSPAPVANTSAVRPLRGPSPTPVKNRRPEIRVVQANTPVAAQPPEPAPVPQAPAPQAAAPVAPPPANVAPPPARTPAPAPAAKAPAPAPKPAPVRAAAPEPAPAPAKPEIDLKLPEFHNPEVQGTFARMSAATKAIGAVLALGIVGAAYYAMNSNSATAKPPAVVVNRGPAYELGKQINSGGWIEDWAPADKDRRLTLLRGSQPYSDYRIEFDAQIQNKAIGWMYRGLNPKNYYVVKLEKLKPGIEPVVAMVRYAVIDGESEKRTEKILPMKVRVDTTYKIRFDAVGNEFALWVNEKKIDEWRDSRLGSGGLGLYAEGEEAAAVHGTVNVFELVSTR